MAERQKPDWPSVLFDVLSGAYLGLVPGVSGLATLAKFNTTTVKLPQLLEVGRATFHALEAAETVIVILLVALGLAARMSKVQWALLGAVAALLVTEMLWVVPLLDQRVEQYLRGAAHDPSNAHTVFIALEGAKIAALLALALLRRIRPPKNL